MVAGARVLGARPMVQEQVTAELGAWASPSCFRFTLSRKRQKMNVTFKAAALFPLGHVSSSVLRAGTAQHCEQVLLKSTELTFHKCSSCDIFIFPENAHVVAIMETGSNRKHHLRIGLCSCLCSFFVCISLVCFSSCFSNALCFLTTRLQTCWALLMSSPVPCGSLQAVGGCCFVCQSF